MSKKFLAEIRRRGALQSAENQSWPQADNEALDRQIRDGQAPHRPQRHRQFHHGADGRRSVCNIYRRVFKIRGRRQAESTGINAPVVRLSRLHLSEFILPRHGKIDARGPLTWHLAIALRRLANLNPVEHHASPWDTSNLGFSDDGT